jgi:serine/threonine protein kinase
MQVIGLSRVGKSWKVQCKKTKQIFAIKEISKSKVIEKKLVSSVISEREILSKLHHAFLISLEYSFQDDENLYLVSEYLPCGHLKFHYEKYRKFSEQQLSKSYVYVLEKYVLKNIIFSKYFSQKFFHKFFNF